MKINKAETKEQISNIKDLYFKSFPRRERKPFSLILKLNKESKGQIFEVTKDGEFCGLIINTISEKSVLLDYLAIKPEYQNMGLGSEIVKNLIEKYQDRFLFCEIETTKKPADNSKERLRRKTFYLNNGFYETGIDISLWGVEMELLSNKPDAKFNDYYDIYYNAYGKDYSIKLKELNKN